MIVKSLMPRQTFHLQESVITLKWNTSCAMGRANDTVMRWGYLRDYPYAARPWYATNQILSLMIICIENVYIQDYI